MTRLLLVGDVHANARWWEEVVVPQAMAAAADRIVQLGDFGYWPDRPGGLRFLEVVERGVEVSGIPVDWLDGNHEHHPSIPHAAEAPYTVGAGVRYLPRGFAFECGVTRILALGGAHSIDRRVRAPDVDWFEAETLRASEIERAETTSVDIVLAHDTFDGYEIPGLVPDHLLPPQFVAELAGCQLHRVKVRRVAAACRPRVWIHGHYHSHYATRVDLLDDHGIDVMGLDCDGSDGALATLDLDHGTWRLRPLRSPRS